MMKSFSLLCASVLLLTPSSIYGAIRSSHFLSDDGLKIESQFPGVGQLVSPTGGLCTAFLVNIPDQPSLNGHVIMSTAHCLKERSSISFSTSLGLSPIVATFLHPGYVGSPSLCSSDDIGLALIWPPQKNGEGFNLLLGAAPIASFHGALLKTVGFGLTGRGDMTILYQDNKKRLSLGKILAPEDSRFSPKKFIATSFSDPETSGLPSYGDCGSPGLALHQGGETVISMVSCLVAPLSKVMVTNQNGQPAGPVELHTLEGLTPEEVQNEAFMDALLARLAPLLNQTGSQVFSFHDGSWSYQIYLPPHRQWIVETFQQMQKGYCINQYWSYHDEHET